MLDRQARYGGPSTPAPAFTIARANVTRVLVVMFIVRGVLSVSDALSLASDGLRLLPIIGPLGFSAVSPLWSILWALLAIVAGVALGRKWRIGWLLGAAVAVAYLVSGIADLSLLDWSSAALGLDRLYVVAIDLLVPAVALALLSIGRTAYLRPRPTRLGRPAERQLRLESSLERWRRRR